MFIFMTFFIINTCAYTLLLLSVAVVLGGNGARFYYRDIMKLKFLEVQWYMHRQTIQIKIKIIEVPIFLY